MYFVIIFNRYSDKLFSHIREKSYIFCYFQMNKETHIDVLIYVICSDCTFKNFVTRNWSGNQNPVLSLNLKYKKNYLLYFKFITCPV